MLEWSTLFPSRGSFTIFCLYIILFVFQGVFVTASKNEDGNYNYDITSVVITTEFFKLIASSILYQYHRGDKPDLIKAIIQNYRLMLLYFVPSLLYCIYNNLAFINLKHYDPTTYYILMQFRVVITGLLYQCIFNRQLTKKQWLSLGILTIGCMVKNFDVATIQNADNSNVWSEIFCIYTVLINVQNLCSCLGGTYNEYLLKTQGADVDIFLQNVFMYLDSVACNLVLLLCTDPTRVAYLFQFNNPYVLPITITGAVVGIVTSFFLKNLNSIIKTYASALELIISAVVCYFLFAIKITMYTIVSIVLVIVAVAMYLKNPVNNISVEKNHQDAKPLLQVVSQ